MTTEVKFKNSNGDVISTSNPTAINDYRTRDGFEEVKSSAKKADSADDKKS